MVQQAKLYAIHVEKPNQDVVDLLEELLIQARKGYVQHLVVGTINRESEVSTAFSAGVQIRDALLAITTLRIRVEARIPSG